MFSSTQVFGPGYCPESEQKNAERAGVCPRCGTDVEQTDHRWTEGEYGDMYPSITCPECGNGYEPDFGWKRGTTRHHKVVVRPDGDGGYVAKFYTGDNDRNPYVRDNLAEVEVFGGASNPNERASFKRVGAVFEGAETLRLYA